MRWLKPGLRNSISALLGSEMYPQSPELLEPVRQAMLDALGDEGSKLSPGLRRRLSYLPDAHALWCVRPEMVAVLSRVHGEVQAIDTVRALSPVFAGLLPRQPHRICQPNPEINRAIL
jgi:hypothetical protein